MSKGVFVRPLIMHTSMSNDIIILFSILDVHRIVVHVPLMLNAHVVALVSVRSTWSVAIASVVSKLTPWSVFTGSSRCLARRLITIIQGARDDLNGRPRPNGSSTFAFLPRVEIPCYTTKCQPAVGGGLSAGL